ncbi:MAG: hypothetical protein Q8P92_03125 [Candidatus Daviesbacteria bacterium]|nr:hypothetical protein [Candidatus Daviesbacteria bacterium]
MVDVSSSELTALKAEAKAEQKSVSDLTRQSLSLRRGLKIISAADLEVVLQNSKGEIVLQMPTPLFVTFLEGDSQLVEHFIKEAPKS